MDDVRRLTDSSAQFGRCLLKVEPPARRPGHRPVLRAPANLCGVALSSSKFFTAERRVALESCDSVRASTSALGCAMRREPGSIGPVPPLTRSNLEHLERPARLQLQAVLTRLVDEAQAALADNFLGAYLVGSFAMGAGDEYSDVDFLIVSRERVDPPQLVALRRMHSRLPDAPGPWATHLEGSYVSAPALRNNPAVTEPWWWVDNGSRDLVEDQHDNTAVSRWVLREYGIALAGPEPRTLVDVVSAEQLRVEAAVHLARWQSIGRTQPGALENAWLQQHAVLACCRDRFTIATGRVASKIEAGRWAIEHLDPAWTVLIQRAIADRPDPWGRVHRTADPAVVEQTREFIHQWNAE